MIKRFLDKIFTTGRKKTEKRDFEWESYQRVTKEQFRKLKDKGLSIPVMTL
jgi:hypothetical protein